jgi:ethanolamine ammonia-lyase large subunit
MANDRTRIFANLRYHDPRAVLVELRRLEAGVAASDASFAVKNLRTRELRPLRELREACIFCYGMTECTAGPNFLVAHAEEQDYDEVATWHVEDCQIFAPIQKREVVPHEVNPTASVQEVIAGLQKYVNSEDLTVQFT